MSSCEVFLDARGGKSIYLTRNTGLNKYLGKKIHVILCKK